MCLLNQKFERKESILHILLREKLESMRMNGVFMAYRNEKQGRQNCFWGQNQSNGFVVGDAWSSMMGMPQSTHGIYTGFPGMWNQCAMPNNMQTCYQNGSPQNPSMGMPQGYLADAYMRQMDMARQEEMERDEQRDMEYWRQMYPEKMRKIQQYVMELCDREDYDDSFIYDEYPDAVSIQNMVQQILERLQQDRMFQDENTTQNQEQQVNMSMGRNNRNWLKDVTSILLFEELHRRRCHSKRCRNRWY